MLLLEGGADKDATVKDWLDLFDILYKDVSFNYVGWVVKDNCSILESGRYRWSFIFEVEKLDDKQKQVLDHWIDGCPSDPSKRSVLTDRQYWLSQRLRFDDVNCLHNLVIGLFWTSDDHEWQDSYSDPTWEKLLKNLKKESFFYQSLQRRYSYPGLINGVLEIHSFRVTSK